MKLGLVVLATTMLAATPTLSQTPASSLPSGRALADSAVPLLDPHVFATAEGLRDRALAGNEAYPFLEGLTTEIGPRPAASEAEHRAADWAAARLKSLGFENVHLEPFIMTAWVRGQETAEVVAPFPRSSRPMTRFWRRRWGR